MKVITLWQPWASLIIDAKKRIETRSWKTDYRGLIGIHAAQKSPIECLLRYMSEDNRRYVFEAYGISTGDVLNWKETLPTGVILGYTTLSDCILITEEFSKFVRTMTMAEHVFGDFTPGRYAWVMDNPIKLKNSIPAKGMQRLWEYDIPIKEAFECKD